MTMIASPKFTNGIFRTASKLAQHE